MMPDELPNFLRGYRQALLDVAELINNGIDNSTGESLGTLQLLMDELTELADGYPTHEELLNPGKD